MNSIYGKFIGLLYYILIKYYSASCLLSKNWSRFINSCYWLVKNFTEP